MMTKDGFRESARNGYDLLPTLHAVMENRIAQTLGQASGIHPRDQACSRTNPGHIQVELSEISAILNGLDTAVFVVDDNRRVIIANEAALKLFGDDLVGEKFVRAIRHPDCLNAVESVFAGAETSEIDVSLQIPVKTLFRVKTTALPHDFKNAPAAVISFEDISHIFEAEQMRSDFIANVSHELRSPLTALSGFIETLQGTARDDAAARAKFLDTMDREAQRMDRLIEDLLSLSKVEVEAHVRPIGLVNINSVIEQVITVLTPLAEKEGSTIQFVRPEKNPGSVTGDEDQLAQIFQNLIENALKYGRPDTEVTITLAEVRRLDPSSEPLLSVEIQDNGPGIPAEHIPRLTERFYRVDRGRSRDKGGTGLGLAIVKHILNRHHGKLQIKSEMGVGSRFTVILPLSE